MMRLIGVFLLFFSVSNITYAATNHADKWFILWGYNRSEYQDSDITFTGSSGGTTGKDYNFTLYNVKASDRQSQVELQFLTPWGMTVPQYNFRLGYYLDETHRAYFGVDHMKYVMVANQVVNKTGTDWNGDAGSTKAIDPTYLQYEHTDGLNYVNFGYEMLYPFWNGNSYKISFMHGPDIGFVLPKTNVTINNVNHHDDFNVAGYGASYKVGFVVDLGENWFGQLEFKKGLLNMPWIRTTSSPEDSASQKIEFWQYGWAFGYVFD